MIKNRAFAFVLPLTFALAVPATLSALTAKSQSAVGSWGHKFALPDGRLGGYGMMNSPGLPQFIGPTIWVCAMKRTKPSMRSST